MRDWVEVCTFACALPEVEMISFYGAPTPKVNGKAFVAISHEKETSFGVFVATMDEKLMLMETDPDTFWQTPHYENSRGVLVRFGSPARERVELYIRRAWWDRLSKDQRARYGERP